ncbi:MAG TPA: GNAT family protein [Paenibacillus sp.]|uniref:GNAT family N-acetyltransferase n=1 Tax=Paenibacillus sp. TaxID=58172 RepID=UPI002C75A1A3|nr:GNAT family protein [Paenibacillus sp.]HUC93718.1 GNAT family protein [Paenibacillus sp.]
MAGGSDHKGFVIADLQSESYIGQIDLFRLDWKNRSAELGLVIGVTRAYRCYLKCGFREEGRLREAHYYNGRYHDIILMSVLRNDVIQGAGV